jgi:hypothetical protein
MGMLGLTNSLAKEGAKHNVRVNYVVPVARSRMSARILPEPLLDILDPAQVAPIITYLSHENCTSTGCSFEVGGGWFSKVRIQRSAGLALGNRGRTATAEQVQEKIRAIGDFDIGATYPELPADTIKAIVQSTEDASNLSSEVDEVYAATKLSGGHSRLVMLKEAVQKHESM